VLRLLVVIGCLIGCSTASAIAQPVDGSSSTSSTSAGSASTTSLVGDRPVRVAVRVLEPFVRKVDGRYSGFSIDLWEELAKRNGYRTTYVEVANVNEQLDAVKQGKADVAITAISVTSDREKTVDFAGPMFNGGLQVAVPAQNTSDSGGVWRALADASILRLLAVLALSIVLAAILVWLLERRRNPEFEHGAVKGVAEGIWWAVVTLLTVGYGDRVTRTVAGRVLSIVWMIFGVLLVAQFTATFTSNLTIRHLHSEIRGVEDLKGRNVATVSGTTAAKYLASHDVAAREVASVDLMLDRVRTNEVDAAVYDAPVLAFHVKETGGRHYQLVGAPFTSEYYGIALHEGSDLRQPLDIALLGVYEDGTYARFYTTWFGS
jgi:polar amino acid transport system substrate-binding protein